MLTKTTLIFVILLKICIAQNTTNCESKETCSECIQEQDCIWCIKIETQNHCINKNGYSAIWCETDQFINPAKSFEIVDDRELTSTDKQLSQEAVQLRPQRIKLKLRKGQEHVINFQYAQARNYPVDLYYIMDLSASMEDHREKLAKLGDKLSKTMINITSDFRLGFGSFVDKVDLPFVSTVPEKLKQPCILPRPGRTVTCVPPYSFKNHMSLNTDHAKFSSEVFKARVSGNLDAPEGGFDAIMQAIVCKKNIGWRSQARHLLVFSTDAEYHIAGDGKLAGVIEPNDAQCHMQDDYYTDYLVYDYPSVSQINYVAKENNINIIFAIVNKGPIVESYRKLSERIENSNTGALDEDSENVVNLVVDNYNKIVDSVTISTNASHNIEVKIASNCPNATVNGCKNIHVGEIVNFTATIKPVECSGQDTKTIIAIKPEGIDESIIVELEVMCNCDCESSSSPFFKPNAPECNQAGTLKCGVCDCNPGHFGRNCECDRLTSASEDVSNCQANATDDRICSGLGTCKCGQCQCNRRQKPGEKIYGKYCDCDNYSCKRADGALCSNRGTCGCGGICTCHPGWAGDACQCPDTNSTCIKPNGDGMVCNGHGKCNCGKCECFDEKVRYSGKFCDECPTCAGQRCEELRHCVECQAYKTGMYKENECRIKCTSFTAEIVEKIDQNQDEGVKICTIPDNGGCTFVFSYEYSRSRELVVKAEKAKSCNEPPPVLAWILGVIGTILLAGLILLIIWKVFMTIHDRREYAKFENERKKMKWHRNDNPLYKEAISTFSNPAYNNRPSNRFSFKNKNTSSDKS